MLLNLVSRWNGTEQQKLEIVLAVLAILSALILISGYHVYSYILVTSTTLLTGIWFLKSINKSQFGAIPWYAFIFILPMLIVPLGFSLKLSIIEGGAFVLFIGISLSLIAIAVLFILVLTVSKKLTYLKNVSIRLVPATSFRNHRLFYTSDADHWNGLFLWSWQNWIFKKQKYQIHTLAKSKNKV